MTDVSAAVRDFFAEFERNGNTHDLDAVAKQFADVFMSADPTRAVAVPRETFLGALPQRERLFATVGLTRTRLASIKETPLDDVYTLVDTEWIGDLRSGGELHLSSTFILRREGQSHVVVFYLNHQDIAQAVQEIAQRHH
jgi:hypothetical protein